jgi:hypothetical protein
MRVSSSFPYVIFAAVAMRTSFTAREVPQESTAPGWRT